MSTTGTTVRVEEVWTLKDEVSNRMQNIERATRRTNEELQSGKSHLSWIERRIASIGVAMGTAYLARVTKDWVTGLVEANNQLELSRLGVAAILYNAGNAGLIEWSKTFEKAQVKAANLYRQMEVDSVNTLSTTQDYLTAWQTLSAPILKARGGIEKINEATKLTIATARMLNMPLDIATFSVKQMLLGMVDARDQLASLFRLTSKEINALKTNPEGALDLVMSKLQENAEAASHTADTMTAKWTAFQDIVTQIKREMGAELFREAKFALEDTYEWWKKNKKEALAMARSIGSDLVANIKIAAGIVKSIAENFGTIVTTVKTLVEVWIGNRLVSAITKATVAMDGLAASTAAAGTAGATGGAAKALLSLSGVGGMVSGYLAITGVEKLMDAVSESKSYNAYMREEFTAAAQAPGIAAYNRAKENMSDLWMKELAWDYAKVSIQDKAGRYPSDQKIYDRFADVMAGVKDGNRFMISAFGEFLRYRTPGKFIGGGFVMPPTGDWMSKGLADPKPPQFHFHGSHFEIKVDARHEDPDRVAASIINAVGKQSLHRSQARTSRAHVTGG